MSDMVNPYQSPETAAVPVTPLVAQGALTETMLIHLKGAAPWLRFIGILGFIATGLTVVWGISLFALIPLFGQTWGELFNFESLSSYSGIFGTILGGSMGLLVTAGGALMFFPSLFMYRFGEKIRSFLRTGVDQDLELAFKNNRSLWKFLGIICIIQLAFIPLLIIAGIIIVAVIALS